MRRFLRRFQASGFLLPAALTGGLWLKGLVPWLPGPSCPWRHLTGIPCPTCFLTRATSAALRGDWPTSLRLHAFGPLVAVALVWWSVEAIRRRRLLPCRIAPWPVLGGAGALVAYWLLRLALSHRPGIPSLLSFPLALN